MADPPTPAHDPERKARLRGNEKKQMRKEMARLKKEVRALGKRVGFDSRR